MLNNAHSRRQLTALQWHLVHQAAKRSIQQMASSTNTNKLHAIRQQSHQAAMAPMSAVEWHMGRRSAASIRAGRLQAAQSSAKHTLVTDSDTDADSVIITATPKPSKAKSFSIASFGSAPSSPVRPFHSHRASAAGGVEDSLPDHHWCRQHQTAFDIEPKSALINCTLACPARAPSGSDQPSAVCGSQHQHSQDAVDRPLPAAHQAAFEGHESHATSNTSANTEAVGGPKQDEDRSTHQV